MPNSIHSLTLKLVSVCLYDGHWAKTAKAGSIGGTIEMGKTKSGDGTPPGGRMQVAAWRSNARLPYYAAVVLLGIGLVMFEYHLQAGQVWGVQVDHFSELQQKELDAFVSMNNLVTSLGTGLLGALFFLVFSWRKAHFAERELLPAFLSAICVSVSLFYGYQAYQDLLLMLENGTFDLTGDVISWDRHAHFYMFGLGVLLFADFAFRELTEVNT